MGVGSVARKYSNLQTRSNRCLSEAAAVQTACWDDAVLEENLGAMDQQAAPTPFQRLNVGKIEIDPAAFAAYLRLYQIPDNTAFPEDTARAACAPEGSAYCRCCGQVARVDAVGFCDACLKVAEPSC